MLEQIPIRNHIPVSRNVAFYLQRYSGKLDSTLEHFWKDFEQNNWEIKHSVCATKYSDNHFTKEFRNIQKKNSILDSSVE